MDPALSAALAALEASALPAPPLATLPPPLAALPPPLATLPPPPAALPPPPAALPAAVLPAAVLPAAPAEAPPGPAQYCLLVDIAKPLGLRVEYRRFAKRCKLNGVCIQDVDPSGQVAHIIRASGQPQWCRAGDRIVRLGVVDVPRKMDADTFAELVGELGAQARARDPATCMMQLTCMATSGLPSLAGGVSAPAKKCGKKHKKKDPNKPKRAASSYSFFLKSRFESLTVKQPGLAFAAASKLIGQEWSAMDANARAKYDALHAEDKVRYAREMKAYTPPVVVPDSDDYDFDADESPAGMESATHYGQAGPSMTTIRKECRHVLNDTIDLLLVLGNMMDVLETGKTFKPESG
jgi:hypothetical protein